MPTRRTPVARAGGARPEALFQPPPERQPLAARMRPRTLAEFVGQDHLVGDLNGQRTVLFLDEIHRFNKAQQHALLLHVEDGTITLIGATTENPSSVTDAVKPPVGWAEWTV